MTTVKQRELDAILPFIEKWGQELQLETESYLKKVTHVWESTGSKGHYIDIFIKHALENIDEANTNWTFLAARIYLHRLYEQAAVSRNYDLNDKYGSFYPLLEQLTEKGIYSPSLITKYSRIEIEYLGDLIEQKRDFLFTYPGILTLATRYLASDFEKNTYELPQERWMVIAMYLMQDEPIGNRLEHVKEAYWALSNLYMTVATPTLANAGKTHGQLSSCFIDTVNDSLQGIYDSNTDIAQLSKNGGGIGVYMGKIRARGSSIKGYYGMSSGVIPWIKQLNNTAVSVDQLGTRKGAITVYLDIWHRDIEDFLDLKLNNGDDRLRAHDVYTGVCIPDYFMEQVENRGDWYLFDPHEVQQVMGFALEDFYDETKGDGRWRKNYEACVRADLRSKRKVPAIEIMKRIMRSQLETGAPFMFYRDEVNRHNPNTHIGMIYCSNLCTEITQNQSATEFFEEYIENENTVVKKYKAGDFVVCNLSSINLGKAVPDQVLERLIPIQVRMLDNVIDINTLPIKQAEITNKKYRAIGLGTFGWHHLLALKNIQWESDEAVQYADKLYEKIAYLTIKSSMELSKEKGHYPVFAGSKWNTGNYFTEKGYISKQWQALMEDVQTYGIRNGYLMAVAPNATTSIIAGSTASIDPIFKPFYTEEKKDYRIPTTAPDLDHRTYNIYRRSAYILDQRWSVKQNAARQKHIDQSLSFNFYVPNTIKAAYLLDLHLQAWRQGLKTTYYVRSTSNDVEECEWCQS
ncbi:ribonucleoside-diphosphate reductase subunit alpha [Caldibacillus lycopersici]|uniref:Ribonucleoside-diphosphate reductase n=1 Tax=Perspicuibacillus lycopersici TaxID=1325689 RepID=A0AAE3IVP9_9BACI|nr:ribonucleoside-diphosphate reductase subunit alpha [Perspicuibacillus lycopersici]MCU9614478.1 ribonucleoside-diphosphate reductase subunit alpha [Perspicuibacillus lycopersici]